MVQMIKKIQVNIPFTMLYDTYLPLIIQYGINPEIGLDAIALDRFSIAEYEDVAQEIHKRGLSITLHGPFMDLSPGSPDPKVRELTRYRFQQLSRLIPIFLPKTVVCHTCYDHKRYGFLKEQWLEYSMELWTWLSESLRKEGAILMLENVYERNPNEFLELFKSLMDRGVGFCLDVGHQTAFSHVDLAEWLDILGEYIYQLHLHDNHGFQDEHLPLGKGKVDFPILFQYLKDKRIQPSIMTIEPHREEDLWPSLEYLEGLWPW